MIEHIDDVIRSGVASVKIEGRMKSLFYLAMVVKMYRDGNLFTNSSISFNFNSLAKIILFNP